jgi:uncharacterized DUF497 family protein
MEFDWDSGNITHISRHDLYPEEVEQVFLDPRKKGTSSRRTENEKRWAIIGQTYSGRILFVVYTKRDARIRVVTARDATISEKRLYRR